MARTSILGKRKANDVPPSNVLTRKRKTLHESVNDENANPEILCDANEHAEHSDLDELAGSGKEVSRAKPAPAKHAAKRVALSPTKANGQRKSNASSKVIENAQLITPPTPRSRDVFAQFVKPSTPKSRVQAGTKASSSPRAPSTPRTTNVYSCAKQLFARSTVGVQLIGREKERAKLSDFLQKGLDSRSGRCLYVSGPPGTGKSAFVGDVCKQYTQCDDVQVTYLNCMSVKSAQDVFEKLATELCDGAPPIRQGGEAFLKAKFFPKDRSSKMHIVTLDEIDHLLTFDLSCVYTIFEWALNPKSQLLLIGIANALDFTDRFLPRLKARSLKPELLPFSPYSVEEINSVIVGKLRSLLPPASADTKHIPFLRPEAIKLLARKVTAQTGDLRKAFDIVCGTLDLIEAKAKADLAPATPPASSPLSENNNLSSPPKSRSPSTPSNAIIAHLTPETAPCATIAHVAKVAASVFNNGPTSRLKSLTLQQKAALCALVSLEKHTLARLKELALSTPSKSTFAKATGVETRKVFDMYKDLCSRENALTVLTRTEFGEIVDGLMEAGLVREAGRGYGGSKGRGRQVIVGANVDRRIESAVTEGEVRGCLEGVAGEVLRGLLVDE